MSDNSQFILSGPDTSLPNSRTLETALGLTLEDTGAGGTLKIVPSGNLGTLANFTTPTDFISYDTINEIIPGGLAAGNGIALTRPAPGVVNIAVVNNTGHQLTQVEVDDVEIVPGRSVLNFTATGSASVSVTDANNKANINIDASPGASTTASYITKTQDPNLPNSQWLQGLPSGLIKVETATGAILHAIANTDYQAPSAILTSIAAVTPATGTQLVGNGTGFDDIIPGPAGTVWTSEGPGVSPSWQIVPGAGGAIVVTSNQTFVDDTTYITNSGSQLTFTMPTLANSNPGKYYVIEGFGAGGWTIAQRAGQTIKVGTISTTTGAGGSISSILPTDSIIIWCVSSDGATTAQFVARLTSGQVNVI